MPELNPKLELQFGELFAPLCPALGNAISESIGQMVVVDTAVAKSVSIEPLMADPAVYLQSQFTFPELGGEESLLLIAEEQGLILVDLLKGNDGSAPSAILDSADLKLASEAFKGIGSGLGVVLGNVLQSPVSLSDSRTELAPLSLPIPFVEAGSAMEVVLSFSIDAVLTGEIRLLFSPSTVYKLLKQEPEVADSLQAQPAADGKASFGIDPAELDMLGASFEGSESLSDGTNPNEFSGGLGGFPQDAGASAFGAENGSPFGMPSNDMGGNPFGAPMGIPGNDPFAGSPFAASPMGNPFGGADNGGPFGGAPIGGPLGGSTPHAFSPFDNFGMNGGGGAARGMDLIMDIPLDVTVELGRVQMLIKDVLDLATGSIVELESVAGEPVDLVVNGQLIAKGEVVVIEDNFGIRLTEILSPGDRLATAGRR